MINYDETCCGGNAYKLHIARTLETDWSYSNIRKYHLARHQGRYENRWKFAGLFRTIQVSVAQITEVPMGAHWPDPYFDVIRTPLETCVHFEARADKMVVRRRADSVGWYFANIGSSRQRPSE